MIRPFMTAGIDGDMVEVTSDQIMTDVMFMRPILERTLDKIVDDTVTAFPYATTKIALQLAMLEYAAKLAKEAFNSSRDEFGTAAREVYDDTTA